MKKKRQDNHNITVYASKFMMAGFLLMIILSYGLFILVVLYDAFVYPQLEGKYFLWGVLIFMLTILPTIIFILTAHRGFLRIEINDQGVKTSLFHFFHKKQFSWEEIREIYYYERIRPFIFVSKAETLQGMSFDKAVKNKDVIVIEITPKIYKAIMHYTGKPIKNLPEQRVKLLKLDE